MDAGGVAKVHEDRGRVLGTTGLSTRGAVVADVYPLDEQLSGKVRRVGDIDFEEDHQGVLWYGIDSSLLSFLVAVLRCVAGLPLVRDDVQLTPAGGVVDEGPRGLVEADALSAKLRGARDPRDDRDHDDPHDEGS